MQVHISANKTYYLIKRDFFGKECAKTLIHLLKIVIYVDNQTPKSNHIAIFT